LRKLCFTLTHFHFILSRTFDVESSNFEPSQPSFTKKRLKSDFVETKE
jgi:hypothetical protein